MVRTLILILVVSLMSVACGSKAKEAKETQEKLAKWEREHQAQSGKAQTNQTSKIREQGFAEGVVARVNEELILFSDLELAGKEVFERIKRETPPQSQEQELQEARRKVLEQLIDKMLLEQEAQRLQVKVTEEEINEAFERLLKSRGLTKEQFYVELSKQRVTPERFRERLRRELMVARMLDILIRSHIHVTDKECQDFFERNYGTLRPGEPPPKDSVRLQQIILLTKGASDKEKAEKKRLLEDIRKRVLKGEDFGKLARQYTEGPNPEKGGDCGFFRPGELIPELDTVAFALKPGEVSEVIETHLGFHLLRVMGRGEAPSTIPDHIRDQIRAYLEERQYQEEVKKFVEGLKKTAFIEVRL